MKSDPAHADPAMLTALGKIALATMQNYSEAVDRLHGMTDFASVAAASTTFTAKDGAGTWKLTMERVDLEDAGPGDDQQGTLELTEAMEITKPYTVEAMVFPLRDGIRAGERINVPQPEFDRVQTFEWTRDYANNTAKWVPVIRGNIVDPAPEIGEQRIVGPDHSEEPLPFSETGIDPAIEARNRRGYEPGYGMPFDDRQPLPGDGTGHGRDSIKQSHRGEGRNFVD